MARGQSTSAWGLTLASADELAEERRSEGWQVVTVRAGHLAPESPAAGDTDRFGYVYLAPGDVAEAFRAATDGATFDDYVVYDRTTGGTHFVVTEVTDAARDVAVILVGAVPVDELDDLARAAAGAGEMYSHVELLDGTHLGSFYHDDPAPFFPEGAR